MSQFGFSRGACYSFTKQSLRYPYVALSVGKEIEIHKLADLAPNMMYNGKGPWTEKNQILHLGNTMDVRYKDGQAAVANVNEMAQERQQERGIAR